jgi:Fic family protein
MQFQAMLYNSYMKNTLEHISFRKAWSLNEKAVNLLGQCYAYVNAMLNIPIRPDYTKALQFISFNKGALATTAIEGNTLTSEDLAQIQSGKNLPPSREYQQREVENVLEAFQTIYKELITEKSPQFISSELLKRFHKMIGKDIGEAFGGDPGRFRRRNVIVGAVYRPPSFELVEGMVKRFCDWLIRKFHYNRKQNFDDAVIEAIVSHVYIAWIHPFIDGNGRTARLLEFYLILRAGIPTFASHILSNHYNETRALYYRQLQRSSETGDLTAFIEYALEGFRDGLENTMEVIHRDQKELTWNSSVHDKLDGMKGKNNKTMQRLRQLAYYIPSDRFFSLDEIIFLSTRIAKEYRNLSIITLRRDLEVLVEAELLKVEKSKYRANHELLYRFLPETSALIKRHY